MKTETDNLTAADWMAELGEGELTPARRIALADWLRDSPAHVRALLEQALLDHDLRGLSIPPDRIDAWVNEAKAAAGGVTSLDSPRMLSLREATAHRVRHWALVASVVLAVSGALSYSWWQSDRYSTDRGELRTLTLADGSVVTLNTESALKVRFSDEARTIDLIRGEAFFRVAHDRNRPFRVVTTDATVKAVGTQFNVRLRDQRTVVSVLDGRVEVASDTPQPIVLDRGDEARIERQDAAHAPKPVVARSTHPHASANIMKAASWTRGKLEFENVSFAEVFSEFQRYRNLSVRFDDPSLGALKLTGAFDANDPRSALDYIATLPGITVEQTGRDSFVVRQKE